MANKYTFALGNAHIAEVTETLTEAGDIEVTYGTPEKIPGVVSVTLSPQGEHIQKEADNDPAYWETYTNDGYTGDITFTEIPDSFKIEYLGYKEDTNGVVCEMADAQPKPFAVLYELSGTDYDVRKVFYRCIASRPNINETTGRKNINEKTFSISCTKAKDTGVVQGTVTNEAATKAIYDTWFTEVTPYTPTAE